MQIARPVIYGLLGAFVGAIIGIFVDFEFEFSQSPFPLYTLLGIATGAVLFGWLGRRNPLPILGFSLGGIAGLYLGSLILEPPLAVILAIVGATAGAYLFNRMGHSISVTLQPEMKGSYFSVLNRMITVYLLIAAGLSYASSSLWPSISQNFSINLVLSVVIAIISSVVAVMYVARTGFLQQKHSPMRIASLLTGSLLIIEVIFILIIPSLREIFDPTYASVLTLTTFATTYLLAKKLV